jgi:hypothetical protein
MRLSKNISRNQLPKLRQDSIEEFGRLLLLRVPLNSLNMMRVRLNRVSRRFGIRS